MQTAAVEPMTNCCALYLNPASDHHIVSTLNTLLAQLKDLWLDHGVGAAKHCGMTQTKMPLCAWRKPSSLMTHTAATQVAGDALQPPVEKRRKKKAQ